MKFYWDKSIRKFRDENGRVISDERMRRYVDATTAALANNFIDRAETLRLDFTASNFAIWNNQTRTDLTALHYAMMMIAFGGRSQMTIEEWNEAESNIGFHIAFFDTFARQVITGAVEMNGNFPIRTSLYALAGYSGYLDGVGIRERNAGKTEERRFTTSGNPCVDCKTEAAIGWSPIGTRRLIGDSVCLVRCRCYFEYR